MTRTMPAKWTPKDLEQDGYPGFIMHVRTNLASGYLQYVVEKQRNGAPGKELDEIFLKMFPGWEGFVDEDGKKIPHTRQGLEAIPADLAQVMWNRRSEAIQEAVMPAPLESESPAESE